MFLSQFITHRLGWYRFNSIEKKPNYSFILVYALIHSMFLLTYIKQYSTSLNYALHSNYTGPFKAGRCNEIIQILAHT